MMQVVQMMQAVQGMQPGQGQRREGGEGGDVCRVETSVRSALKLSARRATRRQARRDALALGKRFYATTLSPLWIENDGKLLGYDQWRENLVEDRLCMHRSSGRYLTRMKYTEMTDTDECVQAAAFVLGLRQTLPHTAFSPPEKVAERVKFQHLLHLMVNSITKACASWQTLPTRVTHPYNPSNTPIGQVAGIWFGLPVMYRAPERFFSFRIDYINEWMHLPLYTQDLQKNYVWAFLNEDEDALLYDAAICTFLFSLLLLSRSGRLYPMGRVEFRNRVSLSERASGMLCAIVNHFSIVENNLLVAATERSVVNPHDIIDACTGRADFDADVFDRFLRIQDRLAHSTHHTFTWPPSILQIN